jgi:signal transduction histidine kinase
MADIYKSLAGTYLKIGDYKNAYKSQLLYSEVKDSLVVAENRVKITTLANRLEIENKQALQNEKYNKMLEAKQSELKQQRIFRNFILFGMFIILVLAVIFFIRFIEKKKLNSKLHNLLSDLKSTQSQLIHSEKMASLGELTAGIAHEIQNPLNFVNNFSELNKELLEEMNQEIENGNLEEVKLLAKDVIDNEQKINHHGKRADAIVKGMLQHSRISSGVKEPTDINALADEYLRLAYHGLRAKEKSFNATMKTDFDVTIGNINVIPQDIGRVILNLITNAFYVVDEKKKIQHDGYEPTVSVSTKKLGDKVLISVKDNGSGIPQNVLDKIFQPFFTTKPAGQGTGLGLSMSYDIIKAHGGELKVENTEGEGAEFVILLPIKNNTNN